MILKDYKLFQMGSTSALCATRRVFGVMHSFGVSQNFLNIPFFLIRGRRNVSTSNNRFRGAAAGSTMKAENVMEDEVAKEFPSPTDEEYGEHTSGYAAFNNEGYVKTTALQRAIITVGSGLSAFFDPTRAGMTIVQQATHKRQKEDKCEL